MKKIYSVTPEGLRVRAGTVRKSYGDEGCARHLELAADEIARLKARRLSDGPNLGATSHTMIAEKSTLTAKFTLLRGEKVLGYLVLPSEQVYDLATRSLRLYDKLEGLDD